ncbi:MAG: ABC transporter ATP-binding protein, partial [Bacteroidetes bacterium SW_7_64_58]
HVLDAVAEKTWRVGHGTVRTFLGNYSDFRWQVEEGSARPLGPPEADPTGLPAESSSNGHAPAGDAETEASEDDAPNPDDCRDGPFADLNSYQIKQKLEETEAQILEIEERQEELEAAMADPEAYEGGGVTARELSDEYNALKQELSDLYEEWEVLTDHVTALEE